MTRMVGTLFQEESGSWWGSERLSISEVAARNESHMRPHSLIGYIDGARHVETAFRGIRFILLLWSLLHRSAIDNYMTQSLALSMLTKLSFMTCSS